MRVVTRATTFGSERSILTLRDCRRISQSTVASDVMGYDPPRTTEASSTNYSLHVYNSENQKSESKEIVRLALPGVGLEN